MIKITALAEQVLNLARARGATLTTAESCTGGMVAAALTDIPGASDVFIGGFVTYANQAKEHWLRVPAPTLTNHGAVSAETAQAMAEGALGTAATTMAVSITGIAGPGGGTAEKPVGLVFIGLANTKAPTQTHQYQFAGDRASIRQQACHEALSLLHKALELLPCP